MAEGIAWLEWQKGQRLAYWPRPFAWSFETHTFALPFILIDLNCLGGC